ncbi:MAG: response regulator transcription factor [Chloroflexota bacterium]|nr:response regulator transcription factor [Chloroflexota bacterium]
MTLHGGCFSTLMGVRHLPPPLDFTASRPFGESGSPYEYIPAASPRQVRVLLAGDHAVLRASLKTMLELDPEIKVVGEAVDDCETVKMARRLRPDVLLIDLDMHLCDCDDFEALAEISRGQLAKSIIALTIHDDLSRSAAARSAGVYLLLEKGVPYKQLIGAVRLASANIQRR